MYIREELVSMSSKSDLSSVAIFSNRVSLRAFTPRDAAEIEFLLAKGSFFYSDYVAVHESAYGT